MIYLISETTVKSLTNVSDNIQPKFLQSAIREAQTIDLQQVLGQPMYDKMLSLVDTGDISKEENSKYKLLLDSYITYFLAYRVISRLCMISTFKIDNVGVTTTQVENVNVLSLEETQSLSSYYTDKSDFYKMELQNFILDNITDYPEVEEYNKNQMHSNLYSAASSGLWLGGKRSRSNGRTWAKRHRGYDNYA